MPECETVIREDRREGKSVRATLSLATRDHTVRAIPGRSVGIVLHQQDDDLRAKRCESAEKSSQEAAWGKHVVTL